jgi:hypothetical protein
MKSVLRIVILALFTVVLIEKAYSQITTEDGQIEATSCGAADSITNLKLGSSGTAICRNGASIRFIGYGPFATITLDKLHDGCSTPDVGPLTCGTSSVPGSLQTMQYANDTTPDATARHGVNFSRIQVFGSSCVQSTLDNPVCRNANGTETMPFPNLAANPATDAPNYDVRATSPLSTEYQNNLIETLTQAEADGVIVELTLLKDQT